MARRVTTAKSHRNVSSEGHGGVVIVERALESVGRLLPNIVADAPMGRVDVEMRSFVRRVGEGVVRVLRRESGCGLPLTGSLVGNLAA